LQRLLRVLVPMAGCIVTSLLTLMKVISVEAGLFVLTLILIGGRMRVFVTVHRDRDRVSLSRVNLRG